MALSIAFVCLAFHIRVGLGHWPEPMMESFTSGAYHVHELVVAVVGCFAVFAAILLWLIAVCVPSMRSSIWTVVIPVGFLD